MRNKQNTPYVRDSFLSLLSLLIIVLNNVIYEYSEAWRNNKDIVLSKNYIVTLFLSRAFVRVLKDNFYWNKMESDISNN